MNEIFDARTTKPKTDKRVLLHIDLRGEHVTDRSYWMIGVWDGKEWTKGHCGPLIENTHRVFAWTDLPPRPHVEGSVQ